MDGEAEHFLGSATDAGAQMAQYFRSWGSMSATEHLARAALLFPHAVLEVLEALEIGEKSTGTRQLGGVPAGAVPLMLVREEEMLLARALELGAMPATTTIRGMAAKGQGTQVAGAGGSKEGEGNSESSMARAEAREHARLSVDRCAWGGVLASPLFRDAARDLAVVRGEEEEGEGEEEDDEGKDGGEMKKIGAFSASDPAERPVEPLSYQYEKMVRVTGLRHAGVFREAVAAACLHRACLAAAAAVDTLARLESEQTVGAGGDHDGEDEYTPGS